MDLVEIAGNPPDRPMVHGCSSVLECKYDPVHSYFHPKIDGESEAFAYARKNRGVLPLVIAQVDHEDTARIQSRMAIAVKFRRAERGGLPVLVKGIDEQDITGPCVPFDERGAILTDYPEAIILGRHEELVANGNDVGIDLDCSDRGFGQIFVAIFRQRSSAESDHLDRPRRGMEEEEAHHLTRIVEYQSVRIVDAHYALDKGPICEEASHIAQLEDERSVQSTAIDQILIAIVAAISFKMTLFPVVIIKAIEQMAQLGSHPILAMQVGTCFGSLGQVALDVEAFCGSIGHRRDIYSADRAPFPRQW